jgi:hypothetical protein
MPRAWPTKRPDNDIKPCLNSPLAPPIHEWRREQEMSGIIALHIFDGPAREDRRGGCYDPSRQTPTEQNIRIMRRTAVRGRPWPIPHMADACLCRGLAALPCPDDPAVADLFGACKWELAILGRWTS